MKIERLWEELETEPMAPTGWLARLANPQPTRYSFHVAFEQKSRARALLFPAEGVPLPHRTQWPECAGLDLQMVIVKGQRHLALKLRDPTTADVFSVVAEDLAARLVNVTDAGGALSTVFNQLGRWQLFLTASRDGLGAERQRGLYGELLLIATALAPRIGMVAATDAWKGSSGAHQDFQVPRGAIEVKASAAKQPTTVRITSERQLDETGVGALFLHVYVLDERDVAGATSTPGESLAMLVARIRGEVSRDVIAAARFEDKLLLAGWLDQHASRYENRRWTIRSHSTFRVSTDFPRVVERGLPVGIGDVSYELDLAACEPFRVTIDAMLDVLF